MNSQKAQSRTPRVVPRQSRIVASDSVLRGRGVVPGTKSQMAYGAASASRCCIKENCLLYVVKTIKGGKFYGKDKEQRKRRPKDKQSRVMQQVLIGVRPACLGMVLGGLLSIPAMPLGNYTLKIGLGVLPVIVTAVLYGPLYGGTVGALTDLVQALIFPKGAYMPWFTVIGALFGVIPGMFFVKGQKPTLKRIFAAVFSGQTVCSVVLNTLLLMWLYGSPWQIVYARLINQAVMIPLYTALVYYVVKLMDKCRII